MQASFPRQLENEVLDYLSEDDPAAIRSRVDLQRINRLMGSAGIIGRTLSRMDEVPERIIELGAGDGTLMLRLATRFHRIWPNVRLTLLDRQHLVSDATRHAIEGLGWPVEILSADVMDWAAQEQKRRWDIAIANLFIHHFDERRITLLFNTLAQRTNAFIACEPRRAHLPLQASRLVRMMGANAVTQEDAVLSVRAGFCGNEMSALWPCAEDWRVQERKAGLFSHLFVADRAGFY